MHRQVVKPTLPRGGGRQLCYRSGGEENDRGSRDAGADSHRWGGLPPVDRGPIGCMAASTSTTTCSPTRWTASSGAAGCSSATSPRSPRPGDWVTRRLGREPVIMVRDRSRRSTCWPTAAPTAARRCAGRTAATTARSSAPTTAGRSGSTAGCEAVPYTAGFHRDQGRPRPRPPGQVEDYRGFVFANVSGDAGPPGRSPRGRRRGADRPAVRPLADGPHPPSAPAGSGTASTSNWKMWPESDNDGYHLDWVHASMVKATPDTLLRGDGARRRGRQHVAGRRPSATGHFELDFRPSYRRELAWLGAGRDKVAAYCDGA